MRGITTLGLILFSLLSWRLEAETPRIPIILVHGYGPKMFSEMTKYRRFLVGDGIADRDIHSLYYPQQEEPLTLQREAQADLKNFLSKYPAGTQFDMITHSFGGFVGWYTVLSTPYAAHLRKYVSLAGMARGVNTLDLCERFYCGETLPKLIPFMNPFVKNVHDTYQAIIDNVDKCSLYSWQDSIINDPADSGALAGGKKVEVKNAAHNDFIRSYSLFRLMRKECYGIQDTNVANFNG